MSGLIESGWGESVRRDLRALASTNPDTSFITSQGIRRIAEQTPAPRRWPARLAIAIALALIAALTVLATPIRAAITRPSTTPALITNPIVQRGCVIRYDTKNAAGTAVIPRIYEDAGHICVGVTDLALDANGDLLINNVGGPWKIVGAWITVDESLAAQGLTCGISGGGTVSLVRCYNRSGVRVRHDSLTMYGPGNNLWFGALNWVG